MGTKSSKTITSKTGSCSNVSQQELPHLRHTWRGLQAGQQGSHTLLCRRHRRPPCPCPCPCPYPCCPRPAEVPTHPHRRSPFHEEEPGVLGCLWSTHMKCSPDGSVRQTDTIKIRVSSITLNQKRTKKKLLPDNCPDSFLHIRDSPYQHLRPTIS